MGTSGEIWDNWKFHWPLFIATLIFPTEETQVVLMQRSEDVVVTWTTGQETHPKAWIFLTCPAADLHLDQGPPGP